MGEELGKFVTDMIEKTEKETISKKETTETKSTPEKQESSKYTMEDISEKAFVVK